MAKIKAKLEERFATSSETPEGTERGHDDVVKRFAGLAWLIVWLSERPVVTLAEYRAEVQRLMKDGPQWGEVEVR